MHYGPPLAYWNLVPVCRPDGGFRDIQCDGVTGYCWCVTKNGFPLMETAKRGMLDCETPGQSLKEDINTVVI